MIICVEGADGTGKTTLARELELRGFTYVHNGPPEPGVKLFDHYAEQILTCRGRNVVFDRLHLGELVYGPVMRGKSLITLEEMRVLNRLLFAQGARIIFCDTDDDVIQRNWLLRRGKEYVDDVDKLWEVITKYRHLMMSEIHRDYRENYNYLNQPLSHWLMRPGMLRDLRGCPDGVWGYPQACFLVVGERPGGKAGHNWDRAFCGMLNSSGFLNRCLWEAGFREHELQFTNARTLDGKIRDLRTLGRGRVVIAFGQLAQQVCLRQGVPHLPMEHPSYVRRFKVPHGREQYVKQLNRYHGEEEAA